MEECPATEAPEQLDGDEKGLRTFIAVAPWALVVREEYG